MILKYQGDRINSEVIALAINVATVRKNALIICEDDGLMYLMARALKTKDSLLFKMIRNLSEHSDETIKLKFLVHSIFLLQ